MCASPRAGFTLLELLVVTVLVGILAGLAVPSLRGAGHRIRVRNALDGVVGDLYHARALAARSGARVQIRFEAGEGGCVERYGLLLPGTPEPRKTVDLSAADPELCLSVSGSPVLTVDSRGMPIGAARKIRVRLGSVADSASLSMVGRVLRFSF